MMIFVIAILLTHYEHNKLIIKGMHAKKNSCRSTISYPSQTLLMNVKILIVRGILSPLGSWTSLTIYSTSHNVSNMSNRFWVF